MCRRDGVKAVLSVPSEKLQEILRMLVMQRLTKPEFTIYLLWKKSRPSWE